MNLPYFNSIRRGMPKSLPQHQEFYEATARGTVLSGFGFGLLMIVIQLIRWAL